MPDLNTLIARANQIGVSLTGQLRRSDVRALAQIWLPDIRFHWDELYHPISLADLVERPAESLTDANRPEFQPRILVIDGGQLVEQAFEPPVVITPEQVGLFDAFDVLNETQVELVGALEAADQRAALTNGTNQRNAKKFFGATDTKSGPPPPGPNDPTVARWPMIVVAEFRMLKEALRYQAAAELDAGYPDEQDALLGFDIVDDLLTGNFGRAEKLQRILDIVDAFDAGEVTEFELLVTNLPSGGFARDLWAKVIGYGFLEYYFIYGYNDYDRFGSPPFVNEHEGDVEGCVIVFERAALERALPDGAGESFAGVGAHSIITSVHEEKQRKDQIRRLDDSAGRPSDLTVWVAGGSHATWLSEGPHDLLEFSDILPGGFGEVPWWVLLVPVVGPVLGFVELIAAVWEHFADAQDETSDEGLRTGPPDTLGALEEPDLFEATTIFDTPLSGDDHLYDDAHRDLLRLRSYPGRWGAHAGLINHSSSFETKTRRYFRTFVRKGFET